MGLRNNPQTVPAQLHWIVLCRFTSPKWTRYGKFSAPFLVEPDTPVKSTLLLKNGCQPHCRRNHWQNSWRGRISHTPSEWYGCIRCSWETRDTVVRTTCSMNAITGIFVCMSQYAPFLITYPRTSPFSEVYHRRTSSTCLPDAMISDVCGVKDYVGYICVRTVFQLLLHYCELRRELSAYQCISGTCSWPF